MTSKGGIKHVDSFNHTIKLLLTDLDRRLPNDHMVYRAKQRINTAISIEPLTVLKAVGDYLVLYQEQIDAREVSFFLDNSYDEDLRKSVNQEKAEIVANLIPKIKQAWRSLNPDDQEEYQNTVIRLLDDYLDARAILKF